LGLEVTTDTPGLTQFK